MMNRGVENRKSEIVNRNSVSRGAKGEGGEEKGRGRERGGGRERRWWCRDCGIGTRDSGLEVTNLWDRVGEGGGGGRG